VSPRARTLRSTVHLVVVAVAALLHGSGCARPEPASAPSRPAAETAAARAEREKRASIAAFHRLDEADPPKLHRVLFVGSSTIRRWNTGKWFPGLELYNRGFDHAETEDIIRAFDQIVVPYEPRAVVYYAGENDLGHGKSVDQVVADFKRFHSLLHERFPDATFLVISLKPSIARWTKVDSVRKTNREILEHLRSDSRAKYIDLFSPLLSESGEPRSEMFQPDGLHLSDAGYEVLTRLVSSALTAEGGVR
jgi:lysophospholipase L1-like esterase